MNKLIVISIVIAVAIGLSVGVMYSSNDVNSTFENEPLPEFDWKSSGPFSIIDKKYRLGDKVFLSIKNLRPNDVGSILWYTPEGILARETGFDGRQKSGFNTYWEPNTNRFKEIYEVEQLIGNWTLVFNGTNYPPLSFEVTEVWVEGAEAEIFDKPRPKSHDIPIGPPLNDTG